MKDSIAAPGTIYIEQLTSLITAVNEAEDAIKKVKDILKEIDEENSAEE